FERFGIEVLATTDKASDPLEHHRAIRESGWQGRVIPCFRPDTVFRIASLEWPAELETLGREHGAPLVDYAEFLDALKDRRAFFKRMGATATDHAVLEPYTVWLPPNGMEVLYQRARQGDVTPTHDESASRRERPPRARHYPAMRLGPPWWFHDSWEGMHRSRGHTTETAGIYKTAGFNDDTRAFCAIPARHDLARRADANFLAGLVARHVIDTSDARRMARALAYDLARETYKL